MKITVIGLGSGSLDSISLGAYKKLHGAQHIYFRTKNHPMVQDLLEEGVLFTAFDPYYDEAENFETTYQRILEELLSAVREFGEIVYAVPGHPRVAETTVDLLLSSDPVASGSVQVDIISSNSFLDDLFVFLDVDPVKNGFVFLDALKFEPTILLSKADFIFTQVYSKMVASDLKLRLLDFLGDETRVVLFKAAGIKDLETKVELPLYELDWTDFEFDHLTSLYIPFSKDQKRFHTLYELIDIIQTLRGDEGCPWDKKQTPKSIMVNLLEEVQELQEAIDNDDVDNTIEELGDVLMLLTMQAQFGSEEEFFNMHDVIDGIVKKMIFRHPHIFGNEKVSSLEEANLLWERQKKQEKRDKV